MRADHWKLARHRQRDRAEAGGESRQGSDPLLPESVCCERYACEGTQTRLRWLRGPGRRYGPRTDQQDVPPGQSGIREARLLRQQRAARGADVFRGADEDQSGTVGYGVRFAGEGVPRGGARGDSPHGERREDLHHHLRPGEPHRRAASLGGDGVGEGGGGVARPLLRGHPGQARHHGERDQPGVDRGQRVEHAAAAGTGSHPQLAYARLDTDGTPGYSGGCRQRGGAVLFGTSRLDNRTGDLRGWWRFINEPGSAARNSAGIAVRLVTSLSRTFLCARSCSSPPSLSPVTPPSPAPSTPPPRRRVASNSPTSPAPGTSSP